MCDPFIDYILSPACTPFLAPLLPATQGGGPCWAGWHAAACGEWAREGAGEGEGEGEAQVRKQPHLQTPTESWTDCEVGGGAAGSKEVTGHFASGIAKQLLADA